MSIFVTGAHTGAGKTCFSVWLLSVCASAGCAGYKSFCCGNRQNAVLLLVASSAGLTIDEVSWTDSLV